MKTIIKALNNLPNRMELDIDPVQSKEFMRRWCSDESLFPTTYTDKDGVTRDITIE